MPGFGEELAVGPLPVARPTPRHHRLLGGYHHQPAPSPIGDWCFQQAATAELLCSKNVRLRCQLSNLCCCCRCFSWADTAVWTRCRVSGQPNLQCSPHTFDGLLLLVVEETHRWQTFASRCIQWRKPHARVDVGGATAGGNGPASFAAAVNPIVGRNVVNQQPAHSSSSFLYSKGAAYLP